MLFLSHLTKEREKRINFLHIIKLLIKKINIIVKHQSVFPYEQIGNNSRTQQSDDKCF